MATLVSGTGNGGATPPAADKHPSEWTPRVVFGFGMAMTALLALVYLGVSTDDPALRGQIVIALSGVAATGASFFLGNMQLARAAAATTGGPTTNVDAQNAEVQVSGDAPPVVRATPRPDAARVVGGGQ